jgi:autotransporter-associated beta strand protein
VSGVVPEWWLYALVMGCSKEVSMKFAHGDRLIVMIVALALALLAGGEAEAGSPYTWTQTTGGPYNWDGSNWGQGASYPSVANDVALVTANLTTNLVINLGTSITVGSISVGDPTAPPFTYTIQPSATQTITLNNGASTATIKKSGLTSGTRANDTISANIILDSDLTFQTDTGGSGCGVTLSGVISENGKKNVTVDFAGLFADLSNANNSYSGKTTINLGTLQFASVGNVGGGNSSLGAPATVSDGMITFGNGSGNCVLKYTGATAATTDRILDMVGATGATRSLQATGAGNVTFASPFVCSGGGFTGTLGVNDASATAYVIILGAVTNAGFSVTVGTAGAPGNGALLGRNTYTNTTTIQRGTLVINSIASADGTPSSLGAPSTPANGTLFLNSGSGSVYATLKYIGTGHSSDRLIALGSLSALNASGYGKLTLGGAVTNSGAVNKTLALDGTGEGEISGVISDYDATRLTSLAKYGSGTWTLKGDNSSGFTGTVTINGAGGTLEVGHDNALNSGALTLTVGNLAAAGAARTLNNTITAISSGFGFTGSEDLTLTTIPATAGARTLYNKIATNKTLTLAAMNLTPDATNRITTLEGAGNTVINGIIANGGAGAGALTMSGTGTLTLKGANTYTGATALNAGGTLVLDYSAQDNSKLDDATPLTLGGANMGGTLILTNSAANHIEQVGSTALNAGGIRVTRPSGGASLRLQVLTRAAGGTIDFGADNIADISLANVNSILGGWATVGGTNWAVGGEGNTPVTAFTSYTTPFPAAGPGGAANNYFHNVAGQAQSAVAANTLKIANGQSSDTLTLNGNLTNTSTTATSLGGILYVGGYDNLYTIGGSGRILPSTAAQELIFNVYTGTLTVSAPIHAAAAAAGSLTKSGAGRLAVSNANAFTGATRANEGILKLQNSTALGTSSSVSVQRGAAVELEGGVTLARALTIHGAGPDNSGALKNVSGANAWSGAITIGTGGARIENADAGNALTLSGGITTAAGKDLTLGGAGNIIVTNGVISGGGSVTKDGSGTLELAGANTYTGPTTLNAGTLKVTGSIANGSMVTVNSNATLSGSGRCYGEVRVRNGGTIRPEGGNLTVSNLVLYAGSTVYREAGSTNRVVVSQTGELVFQRGLTIIGGGVYLAGHVPAGTHTLIEYSGDLNGSVTNLAVLNPDAGAKYEFVDTGTVVAVKVERTAGTMLLVK